MKKFSSENQSCHEIGETIFTSPAEIVQNNQGFSSRREFIRRLAIGTLAVVTSCATTSKTNKSIEKEIKPGNNESIPNYPLPKIEFVENTELHELELPDGIDKSMIDTISKTLSDQLIIIFQDVNRDFVSSDILLLLGKYCIDTLERIHPNFQMFLNEKFKRNPYELLKYLNSLLERNGYYLFVIFDERQPDLSPVTNLYQIYKSESVLINNEKRGCFYILTQGILKKIDSIFEKTSGVVNPALPDVIHFFKDTSENQENLFKNLNVQESKDEKEKGIRNHEAIHIFANDYEPPNSNNKKFGYFFEKLIFKIAPDKKIDLSGRYTFLQLSEICAFGGELALTTDPNQIFYLFYTNPQIFNYKLMKRVFIASLFKQITIHAKDKEHFSLKSNLQSLISYLLKNRDIELVNRIGRDMYNFGMNALQQLR
jgi:hypothetical protein